VSANAALEALALLLPRSSGQSPLLMPGTNACPRWPELALHATNLAKLTVACMQFGKEMCVRVNMLVPTLATLCVLLFDTAALCVLVMLSVNCSISLGQCCAGKQARSC
jgi:hypothetical protein